MSKINSLMVAGVMGLLATAGLAQSAPTNEAAAAMLSDASTRTTFATGNDGANLKVGGDIQFRYTYNTNRPNGSNDVIGFNLPLVRMRFSGNLNENIDFMLEGDFSRSSGTATLSDAYAGWKFNDTTRVQFGQYKLPFLREYNVSDRYQLAADRSVVSYIFGQGRSQGVQLSYDAGSFRFLGAVSDGFKAINTDITNPAESDLALTGRVEFLAMGDRTRLSDFSSQSGEDSSLLFGGAFHYQDGSTQNRMYSYTGDISWESHGWNAFASGVGRNIENAGSSFNDYGFAVQGGYRVTENIEPFARYDIVMADSARGFSNNNFNFLTAGFNYYLYSHTAKFTFDGIWSANETSGLGSLASFSNTGLLGSVEKNELALRAQFQLLF